MILSITGTQAGATPNQLTALTELLAGHASLKVTELHHGCCIGVDAQTHAIALSMGGIPIHGHPGVNSKGLSPKRVVLEGFTELSEPIPYPDRNKIMVDLCDLLVGVPRGPELIRSGTWGTVRYAVRRSCPTLLLSPSGDVERLA